MDKVKINNQVVQMRKHVKRARLFAINRITKQIKQLQLKKGIDSQIEKNQRKIERLLEKVKILKKMVPDFVSKKALSKVQDWNAVLAQKNGLLEDQCLALLANDNVVQKEVNRFYAEECQLAEKIPSLLSEWEIKRGMPKFPDQEKKASDIKRQKLDKIAKRKISHFKGATFPNNVAVDQKMKPPDCNKRLSLDKISDILHVNGNLEDSKKVKSESFSDSDTSEFRELFSKSTKNSKKGNEVSEEENSKSTLEGEPQKYFTKSLEYSEHPLSKEQTKNNVDSAQMTGEPSSLVDFSCEKENIDSEEVSNSLIPKLQTNKKSETHTQPSIFERLSAIASQDTKKLKCTKSNSRYQKTKAIEVLDLSKLQDADQIPIQNIHFDPQRHDVSQKKIPKKDSFFLNGDQVAESSEEDESNNYRDFKNNFCRSRFKSGSTSNFKEKPINKYENKCLNKRNLKQNINNRYQSRKVKDFHQDESRFKRNVKRNSLFNERKSERHHHKNSIPSIVKDSLHSKREKNNSFQSKKQSNEKVDESVQLHPSWEAKNRLKNAAKSGFKGKRIVFD